MAAGISRPTFYFYFESKEALLAQLVDRVDDTKTAAGRRTIALSSFAIDVLRQRRSLLYRGQHPVIIFPSTAATWRDPNNFGREWRPSARIWVCRT